MSTLLVNTIKPSSGDVVAVSGTLDVSGTIKSYALETITETTYLGNSKFGNDVADIHQMTGSLHISGSDLILTAAENTAATSSAVLSAIL